MKSKIKKLDGTAVQIDVSIPKKNVEDAFKKYLGDLKRTAKIPGFREGKAPIDLIEKKYAGDVMEEVKQRLVPEAYQKALEENKLDPLSYPDISTIEVDKNGDMVFTAKVDTYPEVDVKKYKGLKAEREKVKVSDKETKEALDHIAGIHAEFITVDRPVKKGDFGICDVETSMDGKVIAKKRENMWIEAEKEASMLGMGESLCGLTPPAEKEIETALPENYPDKKYAGKKAVFSIKLKEVKERKVPELDEEFAKKLGKEDIKSVKEEIAGQLMEKKEANEKIKVKNQIIEQLISKHKFALPKTMVERQFKVFMEKAEHELLRKGMVKKDIDLHKDEFTSKLRKEAEDKVRVYFILDEIAKLEKIEVEDKEVDEWIKRLADSYNQGFEETKKYYEDHDLIGGLKEQLKEEKTLEFLAAEAVVQEK